MSNEPSATPEPAPPNENRPIQESAPPNIESTTQTHPAHARSNGVVGTVCKSLAGSYSALALLAFTLFFLPWVRLSCNDVEALSQSGFQIMTGEVSENENFKEELEKKLASSMGEFGSGLGGMEGPSDMDLGGMPNAGFEGGMPSQAGPMGGNLSLSPGGGDNEKEMEEFKEDIGPFYPLALLLLGLLLTAIGGAILLIGKPDRRPIVPLIGAIMATLIMVVSLIVKFPMEKKLDEKMPAQMKGLFEFGRTSMPTVTLILAIAILLAVIAHWIVLTATSKQSTAYSPP